jgi:hypothetical protein
VCDFFCSFVDSFLLIRLHADFNKFRFHRLWSMSLKEMGLAIGRVSKSKPVLDGRVLTEPASEYLAQTFGSIRTADEFLDSLGLELSLLWLDSFNWRSLSIFFDRVRAIGFEAGGD